MAGFSSGEACFHVVLFKSSRTKVGYVVKLSFSIAQHKRDKELIKSFVSYFGYGGYSEPNNEKHGVFSASSFANILKFIIPFLTTL